MAYDPMIAAADAWYWAYYNQIRLHSGVFTLKGHEYQVEPLQCKARSQVTMKGAQMGWTEKEIIKTIHGHIHGLYSAGTLYLFPSQAAM
jgi:hypothetical protein